MAEPLPSATPAGAADAVDDETQRDLPKNAEDRKAAAALNALNANEMSQESSATAAKQPSTADQEALGKAMSRLEMASGGVSGENKKKKKDNDGKKKEETKKEEEEVVNNKKKVKISGEDVAFLVEELDLTKLKATELLRSYDGDAVRAALAFIAPPVKV